MGYVLDPEQQELRALDQLVDFNGTDVLEVGCGDGRMTRRYAARAASVLAIDADAGAIERAQAHAAADGLSTATFQTGDLLTTALPAAAFDVVLFSGTL